jgi:excisionase family DNA binding protein
MCAKGTGRTYDLAGTTLVNAAEVAAYFGVSTSTIHAWYRERKMPGHKMAGGRLILFDMAQIEEWAQKHKVLRRDQVTVDPITVPSTMEARIAHLEDNVAALDVTLRETSGVVAREPVRPWPTSWPTSAAPRRRRLSTWVPRSSSV